MVSPSRSIGSLEIWEPEDKSFSKHSLREGKGEDKPNDGAMCNVYIQLLGEENQLDGLSLGEYKVGVECEITIGEGDCSLAELFDKVVCSMQEGEMSYIKSKVDTDGKKVTELDRNQAIKFNMTLTGFSRAANSLDLEQDERLDRAQHHKDKGTALFQGGDIEYAMKRYNRGLDHLRFMESGDLSADMKISFSKLRCQCLLNLAACYGKQNDQDAIIENCSAALKLEPGSVKGLFRRGQAYMAQQEYDKAKEDFLAAKEIEPENKAVMNQLKSVEEKKKKEKQIYQKMFS